MYYGVYVQIIDLSYMTRIMSLHGPTDRIQLKSTQRPCDAIKLSPFESDYTAQGNTQIQCNPYQITKDIFHRI